MTTMRPAPGHDTQAPKNLVTQNVEIEANKPASTPLPAACPRCLRSAVKINLAHPVCKPCASTLARQARMAQEREYLAGWLSSRVTAAGDPLADSALVVYPHDVRMVLRAVERARTEGLNWRNPPAPISYDARLAALMTPWRGAVA